MKDTSRTGEMQARVGERWADNWQSGVLDPYGSQLCAELAALLRDGTCNRNKAQFNETKGGEGRGTFVDPTFPPDLRSVSVAGSPLPQELANFLLSWRRPCDIGPVGATGKKLTVSTFSHGTFVSPCGVY